MLLLVRSGRRSKEVGVIAFGKDAKVYRVCFNVPFKGVGLRQVSGLRSYAWDNRRFRSRGPMVRGQVVRRGLANSVGCAIGLNRFLGIVFCALRGDRDLAIFVLCRYVLFRHFYECDRFKGHAGDTGPFVLPIGGLPFAGRGFRLQVRDNRGTNRRVLGTIGGERYASRHRYDGNRSTREGTKCSVGDVVFLFQGGVAPNCVRKRVRLYGRLFRFDGRSVFSVWSGRSSAGGFDSKVVHD